MSELQFDDQGRLRHLLSLEGLSRPQLISLLDTAEAIRGSQARPVKSLPLLRGRTVVNLFFEPSTRTRASFALAARRLSAHLVDFDVGVSSTSKGESVLDTLWTLEAMGCDLFVVRHRENGTPAFLAEHLRPGVALINAGDGRNAHPTQGLLDMLTIRRCKGDFARLVVTIVGDVRHSRVARSDLHALATLGVAELRVCAPPSLLPETMPVAGVRVFNELAPALRDADVVIALRLQRERMEQGMVLSEADYFRDYGLEESRLDGAHPDVIVMHPGPMNRGVEISSELADGPRSRILEQVSNGVAVRMAVMAELLGKP